MGGILATPAEKYEQFWRNVSWESFLTKVEKEIDEMDKMLSPHSLQNINQMTPSRSIPPVPMALLSVF